MSARSTAAIGCRISSSSRVADYLGESTILLPKKDRGKLGLSKSSSRRCRPGQSVPSDLINPSNTHLRHHRTFRFSLWKVKRGVMFGRPFLIVLARMSTNSSQTPALFHQ